ncbi:MBL fold metallo-hydrolase [Acidianus manzaensis]|uniref:Metallo-beta-lactamase domain-containing protein n=1 Tax=Acidianus manzaensis TaxID=282676 RepID=A0A1W6JWS3_9CREN|nr:MBL fold metallo-hydrolase [Acidianus manzaensis]ARM74682.1 hypothetical protein B6F84_00665 [Acidianus manzaensis]
MIELRNMSNEITLIATEYHDVDLNLLLYRGKTGKSILLDTSTAIQIKSIIDNIGYFPDIAVISHAHLDHAGGSEYLHDHGTIVITHPVSASLLSDLDTAIYSFFPKKYFKWIGEKESISFINLIKEELGNPKITSTQLNNANPVTCFDAFGHVTGAIICRIDNVFFTGDEIQGTGIRDRNETNSIPQISSIEDYLITIYKLINMKPEIIIPAHNYLPNNTRVIEGSSTETFLYSSIEAVLKLLHLTASILEERFLVGYDTLSNLITVFFQLYLLL